MHGFYFFLFLNFSSIVKHFSLQNVLFYFILLFFSFLGGTKMKSHKAGSTHKQKFVFVVLSILEFYFIYVYIYAFLLYLSFSSTRLCKHMKQEGYFKKIFLPLKIQSHF
jgi:hypothetical protein